ncbi:MAG TPA: glycosyltransferase [Ilumatobacteraceae bacterium]
MTTDTATSPAAGASPTAAPSASPSTSPPTSSTSRLVRDVTIVVPSGDPRAEATTRALAGGLADRGLAVRVMMPHERSATRAPTVESPGGGSVRVDRTVGRGPQWLARALADARREAPDVVHLEWPAAATTAAAALASTSVMDWARRVRAGAAHSAPDAAPLVVSLHHVVAHDRSVRAGDVLHGAALATARVLADAVVVDEPASRALVPEAFVIPAGVTRIVLPDRAQARGALGLDERLTVLCLSELHANGGLETVLEAVQLVVAGPAPHRRSDRGYVEALRTLYSGTATFVQPATELDTATCFAGCDVVLVPATDVAASVEPLAIALSSRRPILVSEAVARHMGLATDTVVPLAPQALAARLHGIAVREDGGAVLDRLAGWTAAVAGERTWENAAARYHELYQRVVGEWCARHVEVAA